MDGLRYDYVSAPLGHNAGEPRKKMLRQVITSLRIDWQPAGRSDETCIHDVGLRQILFTDLRAGAVRTN